MSELNDGMPDGIDIHAFFNAVVEQDADKLRSFFEADASVIWANTNEEFTLDEYIRANCEYPGEWQGRIEDIQCYSRFDDKKRISLVAKVWDINGNASRSVSFIELGDSKNGNGLIQSMVEYWGDLGEPPKWRQRLGIGKRYRDEIESV